MPQLRAFAICPTCSELHPSFRGCPACDGDPEAVAAPVAAVAEAGPPQGSADVAAAASLARAPNLLPYVAALSVGVVVACGVLMALIAG